MRSLLCHTANLAQESVLVSSVLLKPEGFAFINTNKIKKIAQTFINPSGTEAGAVVNRELKLRQTPVISTTSRHSCCAESDSIATRFLQCLQLDGVPQPVQGHVNAVCILQIRITTCDGPTSGSYGGEHEDDSLLG